jgi:hypothetical protein
VKQDLKDLKEVIRLTEKLQKSKTPIAQNLIHLGSLMHRQQLQLLGFASGL